MARMQTVRADTRRPWQHAEISYHYTRPVDPFVRFPLNVTDAGKPATLFPYFDNDLGKWAFYLMYARSGDGEGRFWLDRLASNLSPADAERVLVGMDALMEQGFQTTPWLLDGQPVISGAREFIRFLRHNWTDGNTVTEDALLDPPRTFTDAEGLYRLYGVEGLSYQVLRVDAWRDGGEGGWQYNDMRQVGRAEIPFDANAAAVRDLLVDEGFLREDANVTVEAVDTGADEPDYEVCVDDPLDVEQVFVRLAGEKYKRELINDVAAFTLDNFWRGSNRPRAIAEEYLRSRHGEEDLPEQEDIERIVQATLDVWGENEDGRPILLLRGPDW